MKNIFRYFVLVFFVGFFSCETMDEKEIEVSPVYPLSGEWWVTYQVNGEDVFGVGGHYKLYTYNTAANLPTEMWVKGSYPETFSYLVRTNTDVKNRSFSVNGAENEVSDPNLSTLSIENSKVILKGGKSITGVESDSIYIEMKFNDPAAFGLDPNDVVVVSGIRRTGWLEDDY